MNGHHDIETTPVTPTDTIPVHLVAGLYSAFNDQNPDLVDAVLAPDWQDIPLAPGQAPGPAGLKSIIEAFAAAFPDVRITILEAIGTAERIAVRALITGTHEGEWFGIAPTGKPISVAIHEFHHIKDNRITHTWHLEDWFGMLNQVGAWPPAG